MDIKFSYNDGKYDELGRINADGTFKVIATKKRDVKKLLTSIRKAIKKEQKQEYKDFLKFVLDTKFPNGVWNESNSTNTTA